MCIENLTGVLLFLLNLTRKKHIGFSLRVVTCLVRLDFFLLLDVSLIYFHLNNAALVWDGGSFFFLYIFRKTKSSRID